MLGDFDVPFSHCMRACLSCFSCVRLFVTPWTITHQALPMEFSRQEYQTGLPFPSPLSHWQNYKTEKQQKYRKSDQNTPLINAEYTSSFQAPVKHSPRQTVSWVIKQSSATFKRTEITQFMVSDCKGFKLEINNRKATEKSTTMQKIKQHTSLMKTKTQHVKISEMQLRQC